MLVQSTSTVTVTVTVNLVEFKDLLELTERRKKKKNLVDNTEKIQKKFSQNLLKSI